MNKKSLSRTGLFICLILVLNSFSYHRILAVSNNPIVSEWASQEVEEAINLNLVTDDLGSDFRKNISREQFCGLAVQMIYSIIPFQEMSISNPFRDTENEAVKIAYSLGVVNGTSATSFSPKALITRQELASMIVRSLDSLDTTTNGDFFYKGKSFSTSFSDSQQIANWALSNVQLVNAYGIMNGVGNNRIHPLGNTTIEQAVILVKRTYEQYLAGLGQQDELATAQKSELAENVELVGASDAQDFFNKIISVESTDSGRIINFMELPDFLEDNEKNDIIVLAASEMNPYGYIGKISGISENSSNVSVSFTTPAIDQVFETLDVSFDQKLSNNNMIGVELEEGFQLLSENDTMNSIYKGVKDQNSTTSDAKFYTLFDDTDSFRIGVENVILYDKDKNNETISDQLRINGELDIDNLSVDGRLNYSVDGVDELSLISTIEKVGFHLGVTWGSEKEIDLDEALDRSNGGNYVDFGGITIEGVDMSESIIVGSVAYNLLTMMPVGATGEVVKLPLAVVVMLTMDITGEINATVSADFDYETSIKKGFSIVSRNLPKPIDDGDKNYTTEEHYVREYNRSSGEDVNFVFAGSADGSMGVTFGPEVALMVGGIMPISSSVHFGVKGVMNIQGFKIEYADKEWTAEAPEGSIGLQLGIFADIRIRLAVKIKGFVFKESTYGFEHSIEGELILSEKNFNLTSNGASIDDIIGYYDGQYTASQGLTGVTLQIYKDQNGYLEALYHFYPLPSNPSVKEGKYRSSFSYDPFTLAMELKGIEWIQKPVLYSFVNYVGTLQDGVMSGNVLQANSYYPQQNNQVGTYSLTKREDNTDYLAESVGGYLGTYVIGSNIYDLELFMYQNAYGTYNAMFTFTSPTGVTGAFMMDVNYNYILGTYEFIAGEWVTQPGGYVTVNLSGIRVENVISGTVRSSSGSDIGTFSMTKVN